MNLQPLYDIKDRLEQVAVAGTGLLSEDFRLQRAAEALKPLAAASPVFAKIDAGLGKLLAAPAEERPGLLLDLLALVDAVAYTQGRTGAEGELVSLPTGGGMYCDLSYSQLEPLLTALTTTGGGRMEIVQDAWKNHPEWFWDFRVLPALIQDLGDKFADLANLNITILTGMGSAVIPLLKQDFDPAGKADMARRVEVIERIAGAGENPFYLDMLPKSKRSVRESLIWALRLDPDNGEKLTELCRTLKGDALDMAVRALVHSQAPEAQTYFEEMAQRDPERTLDWLRYVHSDGGWAARLTVRLFGEALDRFQASPEEVRNSRTYLYKLLRTLPHKRGPEVWALYRRAAAQGKDLEKADPERRIIMEFGLNHGPNQRPFREALAKTLTGMLVQYPDGEAQELALELYEQYGVTWLLPALAAQMRRLDSAACFDWVEEQAYRDGAPDRKAFQELYLFLSSLNWDTEQACYTAWVVGCMERISIPVLDPRWFRLMTSAGRDMSCLLTNLLLGRKNAPEVLAQVGPYLYQTAVTGDNPNWTGNYIRVLRDLGWTDWDNLFLERAKARGEFVYLELKMGLELLPIPVEERIAQLEQISALGRQGKVKFKFSNGWPENEVQKWITQWKMEQAKAADT